MARLALVTGTSTGIGRAIAIELARRGFEVLAGVRRREEAPPSLEPIVLDVTSPDDIAAAAGRVGGTLDAPVTRALLPALLNARGRIVNISAISGRIAWPMIGPYPASKFALEAVTDALRREVGPQGVHVVSVEPGSIATPVWDKSRAEAERTVAAMPAGTRRRYDGLIDGMLRQSERLARDGLPPEAVAQVVAGRARGAPPSHPLRHRPRGKGAGGTRPPAPGSRVRRPDRPRAQLRPHSRTTGQLRGRRRRASSCRSMSETIPCGRGLVPAEAGHRLRGAADGAAGGAGGGEAPDEHGSHLRTYRPRKQVSGTQSSGKVFAA